MNAIKEIKLNNQEPLFSKNIKRFLKSKGYSVCNVKKMTDSNKWMAVITKNKNFIVATISAKGEHIAGYELSVL